MKYIKLASRLLIAVPIIGYQLPGKFVYVLFGTVQSLKSFRIALGLSFLVIFFLINLLLTRHNALSSADIIFDFMILANLVILYNFRSQDQVGVVRPVLVLLLSGVLIQILLGFYTGSTRLMEVFGRNIVVLGGGSASMSILFGMLLIIGISGVSVNSYVVTPDLRLKRETVFLAFACLVAAIGLVVSGGRTPLAASLLILLISYRSQWKRFILPLASFLLLFYFSEFFELLISRTVLTSREDFLLYSTTGRWEIYQEVFNYLNTREEEWTSCIGCKTNILAFVSDNINRIEDQFHSEPLRLYVILGIIGPALYVIGLLYFSCSIAFKDCRSTLFQQLALYLLLVGLTDNTLIYLHFWLIAYHVGSKSSL